MASRYYNNNYHSDIFGHSGPPPPPPPPLHGPDDIPMQNTYYNKPLPTVMNSGGGDNGIGMSDDPIRENEVGYYGSTVPLTGNNNNEYYPQHQQHDRRSRRKKSRWKRFKWRKVPYFVWTVSIIQVAVFIAELAKMGSYTGSPIQTKPAFNPMIGPSSYVMINMGARFTPCMHEISGVTDVKDLKFPCPNSTDTDSNVCQLETLCGMSGEIPHQWFRFITPIFLHAGFVHIGFNLLLQFTLGAELEKNIGIIRFFIVYFASGIGGFLLGGNFTPNGIASTGASGSLFGVIALDLLDLLFNWQIYVHPRRNLLLHIIEIIISFAIGLLPGLDNFSHIGGFAMGLLVGTAVLRSPLKLRASFGEEEEPQPYDPTDPSSVFMDNKPPQKKTTIHVSHFNWRDPKAHFTNRSRWWYGWLAVRVIAVVLAVVYFVALAKNFNNGGGNCTWCKYLSCLPVHGWCDQGKITTNSSK